MAATRRQRAQRGIIEKLLARKRVDSSGDIRLTIVLRVCSSWQGAGRAIAWLALFFRANDDVSHPIASASGDGVAGFRSSLLRRGCWVRTGYLFVFPNMERLADSPKTRGVNFS